MTSMNNLVQQLYKSDHVQGFLPTLTTQRFPLWAVTHFFSSCKRNELAIKIAKAVLKEVLFAMSNITQVRKPTTKSSKAIRISLIIHTENQNRERNPCGKAKAMVIAFSKGYQPWPKQQKKAEVFLSSIQLSLKKGLRMLTNMLNNLFRWRSDRCLLSCLVPKLTFETAVE